MPATHVAALYVAYFLPCCMCDDMCGCVLQVLAFAAVVTPNQDVAFMLAIGWTAVNLLMSNFMVRYKDMTQVWFSQLR